MTLDKTLMPVPDGHPAVFERSWPLRVGDIDRSGRLRLDAAARLIQDIGQDHVHARGFDKTHPVGVVRRTMIDLIRPIEFQDMLRLRRWCSGTSTRWCEIRVRIDGGAGGLIESEAFWININRDTGMPYLTPGGREDAEQVREYPVRFTDIDLFDHMNNAVYWSVVEDYLSTRPELLGSPLRVTLEHEAPIALGDKLEILAHTHPAGSTDRFGAELADRAVRTLTYVAGDQTKAIASVFAL